MNLEQLSLKELLHIYTVMSYHNIDRKARRTIIENIFYRCDENYVLSDIVYIMQDKKIENLSRL